MVFASSPFLFLYFARMRCAACVVLFCLFVGLRASVSEGIGQGLHLFLAFRICRSGWYITG